MRWWHGCGTPCLVASLICFRECFRTCLGAWGLLRGVYGGRGALSNVLIGCVLESSKGSGLFSQRRIATAAYCYGGALLQRCVGTAACWHSGALLQLPLTFVELFLAQLRGLLRATLIFFQLSCEVFSERHERVESGLPRGYAALRSLSAASVRVVRGGLWDLLSNDAGKQVTYNFS